MNYSYNKILYTNRNGQTITSYNNMDEYHKNNIKHKKLATKKSTMKKISIILFL